MQDLLLSLLEDGSISIANFLLDNYAKLGMTNDEFLLYLQIKKEQSRGNSFPQMDKLADSLGMTSQNLFSTIQALQDKKILEIKQRKDDQGRLTDFYDFSLLYQKMIALFDNKVEETEKMATAKQENNIYDQIQIEFGRPLSPIEIETISQWIDTDHFSYDLIRLALKEAVLNQAYNLKYMDRILLNWQQRHLTTPAQVENSLNSRPTSQDTSSSNKDNQKKHIQIPLVKLTKDN
ncbi:DnaD domain-containing protein [Pediococcus pentosaceus]|uniref:DnaD domain-containing protein n=1 Tax=Pediococcus pentosaceus TaxID=1255 RepID=UPI000D0031CD|nr:DnaD domain protein [Pediococcus pentosaceus]AVL01493.1 DNA replication protein DnaD [Pediococcus pentosaceus]MBF7133884.1 DnaD domain protein [Pediococcus pentosaceus]QPT35626.1 DnaD domain protein [Pediococcus pentosaceus]QYY85881.1 DnaD domain protein [Pediococcus pentosaceus]